MSKPVVLRHLSKTEAEQMAGKINASRTARAWGFQVAPRGDGEVPEIFDLVLLPGEIVLPENEHYRRVEGFVIGLFYGET